MIDALDETEAKDEADKMVETEPITPDYAHETTATEIT